MTVTKIEEKLKMTNEGTWSSTEEEATGRGEWWDVECTRSLPLRPPSTPKLFLAGDANDLCK